MSHITKVEIQLKDKDLDVLEKTSKELCCTVEYNAFYRHYGGSTRADVVIKTPGVYDIGLIKKGNAYELAYDDWNSYIADYFGSKKGQNYTEKNVGLLLQKYARNVLMKNLSRSGLVCMQQHEDVKTGRLILTLSQ